MNMSELPANERGGEAPIDPRVTPELFLAWRSPRSGSANPEQMNNPVWEWLVKSRLNAYQATKLLDGPSAMDAGPGWCFDRFGQSSTLLPDGRTVLIAGEHEDYYDPDFYIYNDVVVQHPDGRVQILGYPREVFPPTDFHSATLVGSQIILIGNLGYPEDRHSGKTQVLALDLENFATRAAQTSGAPPGWLHAHTATLAEDHGTILVTGGRLDRGGQESSLVDNLDDWRLHLADWRWERLTERRWPRWEVRREDDGPNHLFEYQMAAWAAEHPGLFRLGGRSAEGAGGLGLPSLEDELGQAPDLDLFANRYRPPIPHEVLPASEEEERPGVHRIRVDGVVVRYVEDMGTVQVTVEGELPEATLTTLVSDLVEKLSKLENTGCEAIRL